ncbi:MULTISPECIES: hypothetical protein [unclassified Rhizobium]|uniref:hypothetical protein n=1 Tax=unclassified Rhizobium TaxID=2613769 RepID=UPI0015CEE7CB|nr:MULTISPECIES: hypothetical protein [unclassified Rhizobium]MDH7810065.1 hypothetical protein [Rhizobium sp. AN67]MDQ4408649.1 hypothetical protein [Rhizobium sp. AN63]
MRYTFWRRKSGDLRLLMQTIATAPHAVRPYGARQLFVTTDATPSSAELVG